MSGPVRLLVDEIQEHSDAKAEDSNVPLVRRAQAGDEEAFGELWELHKRQITALVNQRLIGHNDVPDVVQEISIKVYRSIRRFEFRSKFSTWLYRIAVNKCNDYLRSQCSMSARTTSLDDAADCAQQSGWDEDTVAAMAIFENVFNASDPRRQDIVKKVLWNGERAGDIAVEWGMKPQQVRDVVKAFLRKVRREMELQRLNRHRWRKG